MELVKKMPDKDPAFSSSELKNQILFRPNKKVLFNTLPIYLYAHNALTSKRNPEKNLDSQRIKWREKLGEPPVVFDSVEMFNSAENLTLYAFNKGYFDAKVVPHVKFKRHHARVNYSLFLNAPYLLKNVLINAEDSLIGVEVKKYIDSANPFRTWYPVDFSQLTKTRTELSDYLRNIGYFTFNQEHVEFELDTFHSTHEAVIYLNISNKEDGLRHVKASFGQTSFYIEANNAFDYSKHPREAYLPGMKFYLDRYPLDVKMLKELCFIDSGSSYNQSDIDKTYRALVESGIFKLVENRIFYDSIHHVVSTRFDLRAANRMYFSLEPEALYSPQGTSGTNFSTYTQRSVGLAGIATFVNRNIGRHGEQFKLNGVVSYDLIFKRDDPGDLRQALQYGLNSSLTIPQWGAIKRLDKKNTFGKSNTVLSLSYQFENNPNFSRRAIPASISFQFIKPKMTWFITPLELSFNRNSLDSGFVDQLSKIDQDFVRRVFTDHLVTAFKAGFIYSNYNTRGKRNLIWIRNTFETSGNNFYFFKRLTDPNGNANEPYQLFGVNYFQYLKYETEFRYRKIIDEANTVATRINFGLGIPFGNSDILPYDKRYFIGGANSLRAWRPRRLGPGDYRDTSSTNSLLLDRSGEFLIEASVEYRFDLIKGLLEAAIFTDVGNIWNLPHKGQKLPGVLTEDQWLQQLAWDAGLGFRFDFQFFLFRLDWAMEIRDPTEPLEKRWSITPQNISNPFTFTRNYTALMIGIGYPF